MYDVAYGVVGLTYDVVMTYDAVVRCRTSRSLGHTTLHVTVARIQMTDPTLARAGQ